MLGLVFGVLLIPLSQREYCGVVPIPVAVPVPRSRDATCGYQDYPDRGDLFQGGGSGEDQGQGQYQVEGQRHPDPRKRLPDGAEVVYPALPNLQQANHGAYSEYEPMERNGVTEAT